LSSWQDVPPEITSAPYSNARFTRSARRVGVSGSVIGPMVVAVSIGLPRTYSCQICSARARKGSNMCSWT
jgi:hypothetical protein